MPLVKPSPCKINLLLNILCRRLDGFHELETVMYPVPLHDRLTLEETQAGIELTCSHPTLSTGPDNLVHKAARAFLETAAIDRGVRIHLEKRIPMEAGLGGGSGNAATTLLGMNELFGDPLPMETLDRVAATLGSDVNFFLYNRPALAVGRGEKVEPLDPFPVMSRASLLLLHPGFGISTGWAYQSLARFPDALNGRPGRAREMIGVLQEGDLRRLGAALYNSLETPALEKYPYLALLKEYLLAEGAPAALMSGSGSTVFALLESADQAEDLRGKVQARFEPAWSACVGLD